MNEPQWRSIFENFNLLVVGVKRDGVINYVNAKFAAVSGYSSEELIGKPLTKLVPEEDRNDIRERVRMAMKGDIRPSVVRNLRAKDGREMQVKWSNVIVRDEKNRITGVLSIGEGITERNHTKQKLNEERERMAVILSMLNTGLALINPDLTIAWVNAETEKILPWEELVGKVCYEAAAKREEPCEDCGALMAFSDGQIHETFRQSPVDGKWHHIVSIPIKDDNGTIVNVLESVTDITTLKQTEQDLEHAVKELEELKDQLEAENIYLKEEVRTVQGFKEIVGKSNPLLYVLSKVEQVAETDATVLIEGETGTGKELIARAIHQASPRSGRPFVKVNCAAVPYQLIENELFGHEPGAFTGADHLHRGRFELSGGGTILLDEISEIPLDLQAKLLGVLQEKKFERIGGSKTLSVDVRIIVATNRNLSDEIAAGRFRTDLFYRLNVFPITVPPLRNRRGDIPLLVEHFVAMFAPRIGKTIDQIPQTIMERLVAYHWPGNVRELRNVIERAVITCPGPELRLPERIGADVPAPEQVVESGNDLLTLEEMERRHILKALKTTGWRISGDKGAAKILNINPSTLRNRMKKLGLKKT
ncbi:sigma 54-interacting transcriptional regulator [Thermodesulfobacteriota bacterium]